MSVERRNLVQAAQTHHKSCLTQAGRPPAQPLLTRNCEQVFYEYLSTFSPKLITVHVHVKNLKLNTKSLNIEYEGLRQT